MAGRHRHGPEAVDRRHRQAQALALRQSGASYRAIAKELGVDASTAYRDVDAALKEVTQEPAQTVLAMELARLDDMQLALRSKALKGDDKAITTSIRLMDRRAKYLGLDNAAAPDVSEEAKAALDALMGAIIASAPTPDAPAEPEPEQ